MTLKENYNTNKAYYHDVNGMIEIQYRENTVLGICFVEHFFENQRNHFSDTVFNELQQLMRGEITAVTFHYEVKATAFQQKVYRALQAVPYGETMTYSEIATQIKHPKAVRAVGNACHKNPLLFVIPCHRIVGKNNIGGFLYGNVLKKQLLLSERQSSLPLKCSLK